MRLRLFALFFLLSLALACLPVAAQAVSVVLGDTTYVYPDDMAGADESEASEISLSMRFESIDPVSLSTVVDPAVPGAVFAIYAKGADGEFVPFPDPADPLRHYIVTYSGQPVTFSIPPSVDLYIRQEVAPEGYSVGEESEGFQRLSKDTPATFVNCAESVQGLVLTLVGNGPQGETRLSGAEFSMEGMDTSHSLVTDEKGTVVLSGLIAGEYTLRQLTVPEGYHIDAAETQITVRPGKVSRIAVTNSIGGVLTVSPVGITVDETLSEKRIALEARTYEVLDESGASFGILACGESISLPADASGSVYLLRAATSAEDGFPPDLLEHAVVLYPGKDIACEPSVKSGKGVFSLSVTSATDGASVAGGMFTVYDTSGSAVMTFRADGEGAYIPRTPLTPGVYTLRIASAPPGYLYTDDELRFQIRPYLTEGRPITELTFDVAPIPASLTSPTVLAASQSMPSLFDESIQIDAQFTLNNRNDLLLPISELSYEIDLPSDPAVSIIRTLEDGVRVELARRLQTPEAEDIREFSLSGTVRYTFTYPSGPASFTDVQVACPFTVQVATFDPPLNTPDYALYGFAKDASGSPVKGVRVTLEDQQGSLVFAETATDPYGAYAFDRATVEKHSGSVVRFYPAAGYGALVRGQDATILDNERRTGRIVLHEVEKPGNLIIRLGDHSPQKPDASGKFAFEGVFTPEDTYSVDVPESIAVQIEAQGDETLIHLYAAASVSGQVADMDLDLLISDVAVSLYREGDLQSGLTDSSGAFSFKGLAAGEYTVSVTVPEGYLQAGVEAIAFTLSAGEKKALDTISLTRPAALEGRLLAESEPLSGIEVTLLPLGESTRTDGEGNFAFEGLELGVYELSVALPEELVLSSQAKPIALSGSGDRAFVTLQTAAPASLSGMVWNDTSDDGLFAAKEPGLSGAEVSLLSEDGALLRTLRTDASGAFAFDGLAPGGYQVGVTLPSNMIFTRKADGVDSLAAGVDGQSGTGEIITLSAGENIDGLLCGAVVSGIVSGVVFEDLDENGLYGEADRPMSGVAFTLYSGGETIASAVSGDDGMYAITELRSGDYTVRVALPEGCLFTQPSQGGAGEIASTLSAAGGRIAEYPVTISRLRAETVVNAGVLRTARVTAQVWLDLDADGIQWREQALHDMTLELHRMHEKGGSTVVETKQTDETGGAVFTDIRPGSYAVCFVLPDSDHSFTAGIADSEGGVGYSEPFTVSEMGEVALPAVGVARLCAVYGVVFADEAYEGLRTEESPGIKNAAVTLLNAAGEALDRQTVDAKGAYAFTGLYAGAYAVRFELPEGFAFTRVRDDARGQGSDVPEVASNICETALFDLAMGDRLSMHAGGYKASSIGGSIWHDAQGRGVYASGNAPLSAITVQLMRNDEVFLQTETDEAGAYLFNSLPPGEYTVRVRLPEGMYFSEQQVLTSRGNHILPTQGNVGRTPAISLSMNEHEKNVDVGIVYTGSLTGTVTDTLTGEGVSGTAVSLVRADEPSVETVTDSNGMYTIEGIRAGKAEIVFTPPEGYLAATDQPEAIAVSIPQNKLLSNVDFALTRETVIIGHVWLDDDANSVWDETKEPIVGVVVALLKHDELPPASEEETGGEALEESYLEQTDADALENVISITGSDQQGGFIFNKLQEGNYSLRIFLPASTLLYAGQNSSIAYLETGKTVDFSAPAYLASYVRGVVFEDDDADGIYSPEERPLEGITVYLVDAQGNTLLEKLTDGEGNYLFNELPPIACSVRVRLPEGYAFARPVAGGSTVLTPESANAQIGSTAPIALSMGDRVNNMDVGMSRPGTIGGIVWLDERTNGLLDTSEPTVPGVQVSLWRVESDGSLTFAAETRTDEDGHYRIFGAPAGYYQLSFTTGGYLPTLRYEGLEPLSSRLPQRSGGTVNTETFLLRSGETLLNVNAGFITQEQAASLGLDVSE